jgi:hypothetical protein
VAVRVLDAKAQRRLRRKDRHYNLLLNALLIVTYLTLVGGLSAITVFVAPIIHVALALAILFALVGGLAHAVWLWSEQQLWRWISYVMWPASILTFFIYTAVTDLLHPTLAIAVILFLAAGGLVYLLPILKERSARVRNGLVGAGLPEDVLGMSKSGVAGEDLQDVE